jgi:hypothetical protein
MATPICLLSRGMVWPLCDSECCVGSASEIRWHFGRQGSERSHRVRQGHSAGLDPPRARVTDRFLFLAIAAALAFLSLSRRLSLSLCLSFFPCLLNRMSCGRFPLIERGRFACTIPELLSTGLRDVPWSLLSIIKNE